MNAPYVIVARPPPQLQPASLHCPKTQKSVPSTKRPAASSLLTAALNASRWLQDSKTGEARSNRSAGGRHAVTGNPGEYSFGQRSRVRGGRAAEMTGGAGHRDAVHRTRESALGAVCD